MRVRQPGSVFRPYGSFELRAARRHVDLLRVSSALCPGSQPTR
ncbi:putative leader peptide [Streptomyces sp. NBC_01477]|nr:putative leader peptide [Streptomyces sp. NBC_01477]